VVFGDFGASDQAGFTAVTYLSIYLHRHAAKMRIHLEYPMQQNQRGLVLWKTKISCCSI
jgi:hypothetical protein